MKTYLKYLNRAYLLGKHFPNKISLELIQVILEGLKEDAKKENVNITFEDLSKKFAEGFNKL